MADVSIFKLDNQTITIKDTTARQAAESAKTLSTTASGNATTALNKVTELESEISALKSDIPTKTSDLTNDSDFMSGMTILAYGKSTWADFIAAYTARHVVYCRASSDSNPASGSQTRMAFMAYVNDESSPTNVEFQYYRSVKSHSATQQGDQVYIYKLDKTAGWTVTVRECYTQIVAGTGITATYSNGVLTIAEQTLATKTGSLIANAISLDNYEEVSVKQTGNVVNVQFEVKNGGYAFGADQFIPCTVTGVDLPVGFIIGNAYSSRNQYSCDHVCYAVMGNDGRIYIRVPTANELWVFVNFTYIV